MEDMYSKYTDLNRQAVVEQHCWIISEAWWVVSGAASGFAKGQWETSERVCRCLTRIWLWALSIFIDLFLDVQGGVTNVFDSVCQNKDDSLTACPSTSICAYVIFLDFIDSLTHTGHRLFSYPVLLQMHYVKWSLPGNIDTYANIWTTLVEPDMHAVYCTLHRFHPSLPFTWHSTVIVVER